MTRSSWQFMHHAAWQWFNCICDLNHRTTNIQHFRFKQTKIIKTAHYHGNVQDYIMFLMLQELRWSRELQCSSPILDIASTTIKGKGRAHNVTVRVVDLHDPNAGPLRMHCGQHGATMLFISQHAAFRRLLSETKAGIRQWWRAIFHDEYPRGMHCQ